MLDAAMHDAQDQVDRAAIEQLAGALRRLLANV